MKKFLQNFSKVALTLVFVTGATAVAVAQGGKGCGEIRASEVEMSFTDAGDLKKVPHPFDGTFQVILSSTFKKELAFPADFVKTIEQYRKAEEDVTISLFEGAKLFLPSRKAIASSSFTRYKTLYIIE